MTDIYATQVPLNVITNAEPELYVTQVPILVLAIDQKPSRVTQVPILVAAEQPPPHVIYTVPQFPVREVWEWSTAVGVTDSRVEQRAALRKQPRVHLRFETPLLTDPERIEAFHLLYRYKFLNYPLYQYGTRLVDVIGNRFYFDIAETNMRAGERIAFLDQNFVVTGSALITTMEADGCTVDAVPSPAPQGFVAPFPNAMLYESQGFGTDSHNGMLPVEMMLATERTLKRLEATDTSSTFDNLPLLPDKFLVDPELNFAFAHNRSVFDNGVARPSSLNTWRSPEIRIPVSYLIDREDLDVWRDFGDRISGRLKPFLLPSFMTDCYLVEQPSVNATRLFVTPGIVETYMRAGIVRHLRIETATGTLYRKIVGATLNEDGTVMLNLTQSIGTNTDIRRISFVYYCRLAEDTITIDHDVNRDCRVSFSVLMLGR